MQIITGKQSRPQRVIIYGPEGIGKSSLAAQFPNPLFADIESGTGTMDVARMPKPSSFAMFKDQLAAIRKDAQGFKTLVIDTADWAERLCIKHVCDAGNKASIEDFGYGKGFVLVEEEWGRMLDYLTEITEQTGMSVVVLAHAHLKKFEQPDESGAYDRYEMKLSKKVAPVTKEWADMVLFCNYETIVVEQDNGAKKAQGGHRVIHTTHHVCWDAKNRHDLPEKLKFPKVGAFDQIAHCFPVSGPLPCSDPKPTAKVDDELKKEIAKDVAEVKEQTQKPIEDACAFPTALFDLMQEHNVTEAEIQKVVFENGDYPEATPIGNYADEYVNGRLVANWEIIVGMIKENRK